MYIDSHAHFDAADPEADAAGVLARARAAGVTRVVAIGGSETLNAGALAAAALAPDQVTVALGFGRDLAPELAPELARDAAALDTAMAQLDGAVAAAGGRVVAIGEIGLDYHYTPETAAAQRALFAAQLALARRRDLPVAVHSRDADADTLALLTAAGVRGVLHCFTGGGTFARALLDIGFHISFSGIVTFRNADALRAVARRIPADRLLIETDSPYLAPVPLRGRRNEPAFLLHVAESLAETRSCGVDEIARVTSENARRLFRTEG